MIETTISVQATKVCHLNLASRATDEFLKKKLSNFMPNDPLKELEEWANKQRVSLEIMVSNGYWDRATYEQNKNYLHCYERFLAKIAELRKTPFSK